MDYVDACPEASANFCHQFQTEQLCDIGVVTHIRLTIVPDGGVSRLRAWGHKHEIY